jgi:hypothetical protein
MHAFGVAQREAVVAAVVALPIRPFATVNSRNAKASFDHLFGGSEEGLRHGETKRLGRR